MTDTLAIAPKVTWLFIFLILYWSYCIFWGVRGATRARSGRDYFLAGGTLPFWVIILATTATSFSGWTFLSHPGQIFQDGLPYAFAGLYAITIPLTGVLFLKRQWLVGRHWGFITPGEMLAWYYRSEVLRLLTVLVALFFSVPYLGLQLKAAGFLFSVVTDGLVGIEFGMWVLSMVVISYVATGGLRTVAYVSLLQALLLAVGIVAIGGVALWLVGGWEQLARGLEALALYDPLRTPEDHSHLVAIPGAIQWVPDGSGAIGGSWTGAMIMTYLLALMGIQSSPAFSMWALAARSPAAFGVQQVWVSGLVMGLILVVFSTAQGLAGHLLGANPVMLFHRPDLVEPLMAVELEGLDIRVLEGGYETLVARLINLAGMAYPWSVGLLTICALAAMESTASAYMATAGAMLTRDVLRRYLLPGCSTRAQKFAGRLAVTGVVVLALLV
ncbi:MAG: sodium:solute symporter family protein, partial [Candidatus Competibacteraceae bacterium]|nr:sodium:solute symporter family protein [Candidatus Competibacteraceae bacterium]